jgi:hypothetical protein
MSADEGPLTLTLALILTRKTTHTHTHTHTHTQITYVGVCPNVSALVTKQRL